MGTKKIKMRKPSALQKARERVVIEEAIRQTHKHAAEKYGPKAFLWGCAFGSVGCGIVFAAALLAGWV